MTEREKRIEEMASDVRFAMQYCVCDNSGEVYGGKITTSPIIISERLFTIGYRKADEVRKETAKKAIDKIIKIFKDLYREDSILTGYDVLNHIAYVAEEFGVEVEE